VEVKQKRRDGHQEKSSNKQRRVDREQGKGRKSNEAKDGPGYKGACCCWVGMSVVLSPAKGRVREREREETEKKREENRSGHRWEDSCELVIHPKCDP